MMFLTYFIYVIFTSIDGIRELVSENHLFVKKNPTAFMYKEFLLCLRGECDFNNSI